MEFIRKNIFNGVTFLLVILLAYFSGKVIVGNPGMSVSGWLFAIAPVAIVGAAIVLIISGSNTGYNIAGFLKPPSIGTLKWLVLIFLPIAFVLSVPVVFNPFDLIVSASTGIVLVVFLLAVSLLLKKRVVDGIGLILISLPFFSYAEHEINRVTDFSSDWITLKIALILVFSFCWFISTFLVDRKRPAIGRLNVLLSAFIGVTLVSALFSSDVVRGLSRWLFEVVYPMIFYFVILNSINNSRDIKRLMLYLIAGVFLDLVMILYFFSKYGSGVSALDPHFLSVIFADGLLVANVLLMIIPLVIAFMATTESKRLRVLFIVLLIIGCIGLTLSLGRMAQISTAIGLFAFGLNRRTRKYAMLFGLAAVAFFVLNSEQIKPYFGKFGVFDSIDKVLHLSSMEKRFGGWQGALRMFESNPVTGVGIGRYIDEYPKYAPQYYAEYARGNVSMISAHNLYLNYLAETGLPGFALLVAIFTVIVKKGFRLLKDGKKDYVIKYSLLISVVVFLINNLVDGITFAYVKDIDKGMVFWSITAMIVSYDMMKRKGRSGGVWSSYD